MDAKEYNKMILSRQFAFLNVDKYHELGYKGQGFTVVNAENYPGKDDHGAMTTGVINDFIPECRVINSIIGGSGRNRHINYQGEYIPLEEAITRLNIKAFTSSHSASFDKTTMDYYKELQERYGVFFFSAAGNDAESVRKDWNRYDTAIAVGAAVIDEKGKVSRVYYSGIGEELDFMCTMGTGNGTSSASPALLSLSILLCQRYGDMNQAELREVFKSITYNMDVDGWDERTGWGIPVLPLTEKLEILETLRKGGTDTMPDKPATLNFTDVNESDWFYDDVKFCVENGLMQGDGDDTFEPQKPVTRAEEAATTRRIYEKIMQEIEGRV